MQTTTKISYEMNTECRNCNKKEVCKIKEEKDNILRVLNTIENTNDYGKPFTIALRCEHFSRRMGTNR